MEETVKSASVSASCMDWAGAVITSRRCHSVVSASVITGTAQKAAGGHSEIIPQWNEYLKD